MSKILSVNNLIFVGAAAITVTLGALWMGCSKDDDKPQTRYDTLEDMQAHKLPYTNAYLNYDGILTETKMSAVNRAGEVDFLFEVDGTLHDKESYAYDKSSFRYTGNDVEQYKPGIPLLRFPFDTGDEWEWSGVYRFGGIDRKASAKITTSSERLTTLAGTYETVLVICEIEIESGSIEPVRKEHKFWFRPGKGLIRLDIQDYGSREPMPDRPDDEE